MEILGYIAAIGIGLSLGLVGAGGSILTVPVLVYLFGIDPTLATAYSLVIIAATTSVGAFKLSKAIGQFFGGLLLRLKFYAYGIFNPPFYFANHSRYFV